jgi:hypothetical protein
MNGSPGLVAGVLPLLAAVGIALLPATNAHPELSDHRRLAGPSFRRRGGASTPSMPAGSSRAQDRLPALGASYHLGADGISRCSCYTTIITASWCWRDPGGRARARSSRRGPWRSRHMLGRSPLDLPLLYVFWGDADPDGRADRRGAGRGGVRSGQVLPLHQAGSVLVLVGILWLYFLQKAVSGHPRSIWTRSTPPVPRTPAWLSSPSHSPSRRVPMSCSTLLPDAHVGAPTAGSVIPASSLQDGTYGFVRASPFRSFPPGSRWPRRGSWRSDRGHHLRRWSRWCSPI